MPDVTTLAAVAAVWLLSVAYFVYELMHVPELPDQEEDDEGDPFRDRYFDGTGGPP